METKFGPDRWSSEAFAAIQIHDVWHYYGCCERIHCFGRYKPGCGFATEIMRDGKQVRMGVAGTIAPFIH